MFKHSFGQPVICTKLGKKVAGFDTKNEFGVVVCSGHPGNGTSMIHFPSRGTRVVSPRFDIREISLGNKPQMSIKEGKDLLPRLGDDGSWHLVSRGDSNILVKQVAASLESESVAESLDINDGILTTTFNSSVAADEVFSELAKRKLVTDVPLVKEHELFVEGFVDKEDHLVRDSEGNQISALPATDEVVSPLQQPPTELPMAVSSSGRPIRSTAGKNSWRSYISNIIVLMASGALLLAGSVQRPTSNFPIFADPNANPVPVAVTGEEGLDPDVSPLMDDVTVSTDDFLHQLPDWGGKSVELDEEDWFETEYMPWMANIAISDEEYLRQNPKWSKAKVGPDKEKWLAADEKERSQMIDPPNCKMEQVSGGLDGVPFGIPVLPIKRVCKIKDGEQYMMRWCVLGNLDTYGGDTFAPTVCKKVVWLIFAVSTLLGLKNQFFDIKGAFMAERPTRDIYVSIDGMVYKLLFSVYGLTDAPKIFNDGLVAHLLAGGYIQSQFDQCFFVKWVSPTEFIYIIFHVDDFKASGTSEAIIDEFEAYLKTKYTVTSKTDGLFLGIRIEKQPDGKSSVYTKPRLLQSIFDKFLPNGPTMSLALASTENEIGVIVEGVKDSILLGGCLEEMHQTQFVIVAIIVGFVICCQK